MRAPPLRLPALRALAPLMLTMRPQPCFFMSGMTARQQRSAPTYFTLKSSSRSSSTIGFDRSDGAGRTARRGAAVHQDVHAAELPCRLGDHGVDLILAGDIGGQRKDAPVRFGRQLLRRRLQVGAGCARRSPRRRLRAPVRGQWLCRCPGCRPSRSHACPAVRAPWRLSPRPRFCASRRIVLAERTRRKSCPQCGKRSATRRRAAKAVRTCPWTPLNAERDARLRCQTFSMAAGTPRPGGAQLAAGAHQPGAGGDGHDRRDDDGQAWPEYPGRRRTRRQSLFCRLHLRRRPAERGNADDGAGAWPRRLRPRPSQNRPAGFLVGGLPRGARLAGAVVERTAAQRHGTATRAVSRGGDLCSRVAVGVAAVVVLPGAARLSSARWNVRSGRW